jgi:hypothetical protein
MKDILVSFEEVLTMKVILCKINPLSFFNRTESWDRRIASTRKNVVLYEEFEVSVIILILSCIRIIQYNWIIKER